MQHLPQLVQASTSLMELRPYGRSYVDITNNISCSFTVNVVVEKRHDAGAGTYTSMHPLPSWLEVSPTLFNLGPGLQQGGCDWDPHLGRKRIYVRALEADVQLPTEPLQLRFILRPLWGCETMAAALGPAVSVTGVNRLL